MLEAGEGVGVTADGDGVSFGVVNILIVNRDDDGTTL